MTKVCNIVNSVISGMFSKYIFFQAFARGAYFYMVAFIECGARFQNHPFASKLFSSVSAFSLYGSKYVPQPQINIVFRSPLWKVTISPTTLTIIAQFS